MKQQKLEGVDHEKFGIFSVAGRRITDALGSKKTSRDPWKPWNLPV